MDIKEDGEQILGKFRNVVLEKDWNNKVDVYGKK